MERETNDFINNLRQGNLTAQQRLLTDYGPSVFRLIMRIVGRQEDAEEVYQDVFVKALDKISTFEPRKSSLSTWLSRIAYNESLNHLRRSRLHLLYIEDIEPEEDNEEISFENTYDEQTIQLLEKAITMLPTTDQTLLSMFYYENLSLQEISYITGSIPSTVGSRLSRMRKKLYKLIKNYS